jgi:hypothetical protein
VLKTGNSFRASQVRRKKSLNDFTPPTRKVKMKKKMPLVRKEGTKCQNGILLIIKSIFEIS